MPTPSVESILPVDVVFNSSCRHRALRASFPWTWYSLVHADTESLWRSIFGGRCCRGPVGCLSSAGASKAPSAPRRARAPRHPRAAATVRRQPRRASRCFRHADAAPAATAGGRPSHRAAMDGEGQAMDC
jgi:hypothetical protein